MALGLCSLLLLGRSLTARDTQEEPEWRTIAKDLSRFSFLTVPQSNQPRLLVLIESSLNSSDPDQHQLSCFTEPAFFSEWANWIAYDIVRVPPPSDPSSSLAQFDPSRYDILFSAVDPWSTHAAAIRSHTKSIRWKLHHHPSLCEEIPHDLGPFDAALCPLRQIHHQPPAIRVYSAVQSNHSSNSSTNIRYLACPIDGSFNRFNHRRKTRDVVILLEYEGLVATRGTIDYYESLYAAVHRLPYRVQTVSLSAQHPRASRSFLSSRTDPQYAALMAEAWIYVTAVPWLYDKAATEAQMAGAYVLSIDHALSPSLFDWGVTGFDVSRDLFEIQRTVDHIVRSYDPAVPRTFANTFSWNTVTSQLRRMIASALIRDRLPQEEKQRKGPFRSMIV